MMTRRTRRPCARYRGSEPWQIGVVRRPRACPCAVARSPCSVDRDNWGGSDGDQIAVYLLLPNPMNAMKSSASLANMGMDIIRMTSVIWSEQPLSAEEENARSSGSCISGIEPADGLPSLAGEKRGKPNSISAARPLCCEVGRCKGQGLGCVAHDGFIEKRPAPRPFRRRRRDETVAQAWFQRRHVIVVDGGGDDGFEAGLQRSIGARSLADVEGPALRRYRHAR